MPWYMFGYCNLKIGNEETLHDVSEVKWSNRGKQGSGGIS